MELSPDQIAEYRAEKLRQLPPLSEEIGCMLFEIKVEFVEPVRSEANE